MGKRRDLTGERFGELRVVKPADNVVFRSSSQTAWLCDCSCGKSIVAATSWLRSGMKWSCGCKNFTRPHKNALSNPVDASWKGLFYRTKNAARKRCIAWNLLFDEWFGLVQMPCTWCGIEPFERYNVAISKNGNSQRQHLTDAVLQGWIKYNGIDREDSTVGYLIQNCKPCCKWCNFAKNEMTEWQFKEWIRKVAEHALGLYKRHPFTP